jgi:biotin carboxyl carrier protein
VRQGTAAPPDQHTTSLSASIPAVVSEILVKVGQEVKIGDKLILLESMKMILPIQAPRAGFVTAINCVPGQAVQPGIQLVEIEEQK